MGTRSGTFGEAALALGRECILVDNNPEALRVMEVRFAGADVEWRDWTPSEEYASTAHGRLFG
jgi:hypothetical protein